MIRVMCIDYSLIACNRRNTSDKLGERRSICRRILQSLSTVDRRAAAAAAAAAAVVAHSNGAGVDQQR